MKTDSHKKLKIFSFVILIGIAFMGYAIFKSHQKLYDSEEWVRHTEQVIHQSGTILSHAMDLQNASRGFVITNDSANLETLYTTERTIFNSIDQLKQLTRDNPVQQPRIDSLNFYVHKRLDFSSQTVEIKHKQGLAAAIAYISTKEGERYTNHIHRITQVIQKDENILLRQRRDTNDRSMAAFNRLSIVLFVLLTVFTFLLLVLSRKYLLQTKEKGKRAAALTIANKELTFQNEEKARRASELTLSNTELKKAEEKIIKTSNLYAFISQVNQNIVRVKDEETLFRNACRMALEFGKFKMAWIGMFDSTGKKINLVEQSGIPVEHIKLVTDMPYQSNGPQDQVLRTGTYFISNDIEHDLNLTKWKKLATELGIRSCMVLPIKKSEIIIGTLNLYASELDFSEKETIALLVEVSGDISFALDLFEKAKIHKKTENLVNLNEKRFRALIEKNEDMISLRSPEGKLFYLSPSVSKVLGYSVEEVLRNPIFYLIHPDDLAGLQEQTTLILKTPGASFSRQQRYLHKNGNWIWCEGTVTNMLHEPGVNALVSNFRDISERKSAEQYRDFNKNNLKALINNTNDLMWSVDTDFKLITSNHAFDEMVKHLSGFTPEKGSTVLGGVNQEQLMRFRKNYDRAFSGETFTELEHNDFPFELWSEISYHPIHKEGAVIGTACFSRDVTEQKKAENNLRLLESVITNTSDSVLITEADSIDGSGPKIVYVNDAFTTMTGYTKEEAIGKTPRMLQGLKSDRAELDRLRNSLEKLEPCEVEITNYKKSGEEFCINMEIAPVINDEGLPTHFIAIGRDVTERLKNTEAIKEQNIKLREIARMQSHDLRGPLARILGLISLLNNHSKDEDKEEIISHLLPSANELDNVISQIVREAQEVSQ